MSELRSRIEARRKRLEADLLEAKANAQAAGKEAVDQLKAKIAELDDALKDGWENLSDQVSERLNKWLGRDDESPPDAKTQG